MKLIRVVLLARRETMLAAIDGIHDCIIVVALRTLVAMCSEIVFELKWSFVHVKPKIPV
jgi:hypothetical protein